MILDLEQFLEREQPYWDEFRRLLDRNDSELNRKIPLDEARRFHYLYQRASSDLVKLKTFAGDVEAKKFLENLIARGYRQLHEQKGRSIPFRPLSWLLYEVPATFRRHWRAFAIAMATFWLGAVFGGYFLHRDYENKAALVPGQFSHLLQDPSERVAKEEEQGFDSFAGRQSFAASLQKNNITVSIRVLCWGILLGVMTLVELFFNGRIIGLVMFDYIKSGETEFLIAWLLPHGSFELTAIFIAGQAGLVIAHAVFGWRTNLKLRQRLRRIHSDLGTLIGLLVLMLIWAGIVESFISQYHSPSFYKLKIGLGVVHTGLLIWYFLFCGRNKSEKLKSTANV